MNIGQLCSPPSCLSGTYEESVQLTVTAQKMRDKSSLLHLVKILPLYWNVKAFAVKRKSVLKSGMIVSYWNNGGIWESQPPVRCLLYQVLDNG